MNNYLIQKYLITTIIILYALPWFERRTSQCEKMKKTVSKGTGRTVSMLLGAMLCASIMHLNITPASAQISESFESGFGDWAGDCNYPAGFFDVSISSLYAYDGSFSVSLWNHGMDPATAVWIERPVPVPQGATRNVEMTFWLYSEGLDSPREVLAFIGVFNPEIYLHFAIIGQTDQVADDWFQYSYSNTLTAGPSGFIYVGVGFANDIIGSGKTYYIDLIELTNVSDDITPPMFTNLQPANNSITSNTMPIISANYSDASGINVSSVLLEVDGADVTGISLVTASGIEYITPLPLTEGNHTVYIEARDASINSNLGNTTWNFTVDTTPPEITNPQPPNASTTTDNTPNISADYSDPAGIDTSSVVIEVDAINVTSSAMITASNSTYTPLATLLDGPHNIYLEVKDAVGNLNSTLWSFTVDTSSDITPPNITNLQPANNSIIGETMPLISANYSDYSGINVTSIVIEVDSINVTSFANITAKGVNYTPAIPLSESIHNVTLKVRDDSINHNLAIETWRFTVEDTPPTTNLAIEMPNYVSGGTTYFNSITLFNLTADDGLGTGVNSTWYGVWNNVSGWSALTQYTIPFTISGGDGIRYIEYNSTDNVSNHETPINYTAFSELYLDNAPPFTILTMGSPAYVSGPDTFVTYSTEFNLSASNIAGINGIWYKIDAAGAWTPYVNNFTIIAEGPHTIYYNATDNLGNTEIPKTFAVIVDNTPPTTLLTIDTPKFIAAGTTYFTSASEFTLTAPDAASTWYRIWNSTSGWSGLTQYTTPFTISGADGIRYIEYNSTDNVTNQEIPVNYSAYSELYLDNTEPLTSLSIGIPKYVSGPDTFISTSTELNLTSANVAGIESIWYKIDGGGVWTLYTGNFSIAVEGAHTIYYNATDNLGNVETTRTKAIIVDNTPPTTIIDVGTPKYGTTPVFVSSSTLFTLSAIDTESDVSATMYEIDSSGFSQYIGGFALSVLLDDGLHAIRYYSVDNVGNTEMTNTYLVFLDNEPPIADAGPDVSIPEGNIVIFNGSQSSDNSGSIFNYTWTFIYSGLHIELYSVETSYQFNIVGNYEVILNVTDFVGNSATDKLWVNVTSIEDSDNDGLPDSWEQEHFGNLEQDATGDPDSDGFTNYQEWQNGTDPMVSDKQTPAEFPWWIILVLIIIIMIVFILLLLLKRRKHEEEVPSEEAPEEEEEELGVEESEEE